MEEEKQDNIAVTAPEEEKEDNIAVPVPEEEKKEGNIVEVPKEEPKEGHVLASPQEFVMPPHCPIKAKLLTLVEDLIEKRDNDAILKLFAPGCTKNIELLEDLSNDLVEVLFHNVMTQENAEKCPPLYQCCETVLRLLVDHTNPDALLLEILEVFEEETSDIVFTSLLKAFERLLTRNPKHRIRNLHWCFESIITRLHKLPLPLFVYEGYDEKQKHLLEQNEKIQNLFMHLVTIDLFMQPLLKSVTEQRKNKDPSIIFRDCGFTETNVICCFLVKLLGHPLSELDLSKEEDKNTNSYTVQCTTNITKGITTCIVDPLYLLSIVENRERWTISEKYSKFGLGLYCSNIFYDSEKLPLEPLAVYFYMLFVENVEFEFLPKVYAPLFIFESGLYLVNKLLKNTSSELQYRGMQLAKKFLMNLNNARIPVASVQLLVHKQFCNLMINIIEFNPRLHIRQYSVELLKSYILQFDYEGQNLVLKNLLDTKLFTGMSGFLATMYKDMIGKSLNFDESNPSALLPNFTKKDFRYIIMDIICHLPRGAETDLIEQQEKIIPGMNALRYFIIRDTKNATGFWDFFPEIEKKYLKPLREAINMSIAHYNTRLKATESGEIDEQLENVEKAMKMLNVNIQNDPDEKQNDSDNDKQQQQQDDKNEDSKKKQNKPIMNLEQRIFVIKQSLMILSIMNSVLGRITECIDMAKKQMRSTDNSDSKSDAKAVAEADDKMVGEPVVSKDENSDGASDGDNAKTMPVKN